MVQRTFVIIASLMVALCASAERLPQAGPRRMAYRWTSGEAARYRLTADLSGSLPIMQSVEPIDLEATLELIYKVLPRSVEPQGGATLDFRIEKAEAELARIPLPVPFEDAQKVLNRTVVFDSTGAVKEIKAAEPLPFAVTIPGVDPQRLFTLIYPIVFPDRPIKPGDTWQYQSELLGSEGTPASFTATVLESEPVKATGSRKVAGNAEPPLRVRQEFTMAVDQRLNADKKPAADGEAVRRTRTGKITGVGVMAFSPARGKLIRGHVTIQADILERVVGEPEPDEAPEVASKVKAVVQIAPVPPPAPEQPVRRKRT